MKNTLFILCILINNSVLAQVGINTNNPGSSLHVNGSLASNYKKISTNYSLDELDFYVVYENFGSNNPNNTLTLPIVDKSSNFKGRIYQIKNQSPFPITITTSSNSQQMRVGKSSGANSLLLESGSYVEIVMTGVLSGNTWEIMYISKPEKNKESNVSIYTAKLALPPMNISGGIADWSNENNESDNYNNGINRYPDVNGYVWKIINKKSLPFSRLMSSEGSSIEYMIGYNLSSIELEYEYTGPAIDPEIISKVFPIVTTGNVKSLTTSSHVFVPSIVYFYNSSNKTRLKIKVTRVDKISYQEESQSTSTPSGENSNWNESFVMNLILATKLI